MGFGVGGRFVMHCLGSPILIFFQGLPEKCVTLRIGPVNIKAALT